MNTHGKPQRARLVYDKPIGMRMTEQELAQMRELAEKQGRSLSNMARQMCLLGLRQMQSQAPQPAEAQS